MKEVVINMCEVSVGILYCDVIELPMVVKHVRVANSALAMTACKADYSF
jgi:hypothetical protein